MFCPKCGREGKIGEVYCGGCGVRLPWEEDAKQADAVTEEEVTGRANDAAAEKVIGQAGTVVMEERAGQTNAVTKEEATGRADAVTGEEAARRADAVTEEEVTGRADAVTGEEATGQTDAVMAEEVIKREDAAAEKEAATETAETLGTEPTTFVIKKSTIKKALFGLAGFVAAIILLVCCLGNAEIRDIKNGVLEDYNYGVSIGDALHKWFEGTEKWSSFSEDGVVYVMARGMTKYTATRKTQEQMFLFHHVSDEYFVFDGAFDANGDYLYTGNAVLDYLDFGDLIVWGLYEQTLKAAFGDKEALQMFIDLK